MAGTFPRQVLVGLLYFFSEERMQDPYEAIGTDVLAKEPHLRVSHVVKVLEKDVLPKLDILSFSHFDWSGF